MQKWLISLALGAIVLMMLSPFLTTIFLALMFAVLLIPVRKAISKRYTKRFSTPLTILFFILAIAIPAIILSTFTINELIKLSDELSQNELFQNENISELVNNILDNINEVSNGVINVTEEQIIDALSNSVSSISSILLESTLRVGTAAISVLTTLIIFLTILWSIIGSYDRFVKFLSEVSPFSKGLNIKIATVFKKSTKDLLISIFFVAFLQAFASWIVLSLLNIPFAFLLSLITFVASVLPLGSGFITIPVSIILILTGDFAKGLILLVYTVAIVTNIDNVIRPLLASKESNLNFSLLLLGILGGTIMFGFWGLIIGPIILELAIVIFKDLQIKYLDNDV